MSTLEDANDSSQVETGKKKNGSQRRNVGPIWI